MNKQFIKGVMFSLIFIISVAVVSSILWVLVIFYGEVMFMKITLVMAVAAIAMLAWMIVVITLK